VSRFIGFGSGFTQNPLFFMGFIFLKPYSPSYPTQPTFFGIFGVAEIFKQLYFGL